MSAMKNKINYLESPQKHPHYGEIQYDVNGDPVCHICGKSFPKLCAHIWNGHRIKAKDYKKTFGLDVKKGICSKEYIEKMSAYTQEHYQVVVKQNLIEKGKHSRFKAGSKGRTSDMVSEQTRRRLSELGRKTSGANLKKTRTHLIHEQNKNCKASE